tara:strand:+ start:426 stop:1160 length:735 start_codon:yes stop_codon:yes gene_type:complete
MNNFKSKISDISVENIKTFNNNFISFDIDWAHDDVINYSIDILEKTEIRVSWFITHKTKVLERLKENSNFEIGIHPNFNFLLDGDFSLGKNAEEVIARLMKIVPDAKLIKSHSLTQSSVLLDLFLKFGLTHELNNYIPYSSSKDINIRPWKHWNGIVRVPFNWEDDIACLDGLDRSNTHKGLLNFKKFNIFCFHPIHIYLNTKNLDNEYKPSKKFINDPLKLKKFEQTNYGCRNFLQELINFNN